MSKDRPTQQRFLVFLPAYNEAGAIRRVVAQIKAAAPSADVLVVDDGSRDQTAQEAQAAGAITVQHPFNLGIGGAVQTGLKFALYRRYPYVLRMDGDGQHNPGDIPKVLNPVLTGEADAVFGSRFLGTDADMRIPFSRKIGIATFRSMVTLLTGQKTTDTTSGFFAMNNRAAAVLAKFMPQDYPEVESRVILHKAGLQMLEVPVYMLARTSGVSSINSWRSVYYAAKVSVATLITALKIIPKAPHKMEQSPNSALKLPELRLPVYEPDSALINRK